MQTYLIWGGQQFLSVVFRQWVSGIRPAGDGGEHRASYEGPSFLVSGQIAVAEGESTQGSGDQSEARPGFSPSIRRRS